MSEREQIWKIQLDIGTRAQSQIEVPVGSRLLDLQVQKNGGAKIGDMQHMPVMWWEVPDLKAEMETYTFEAIGTGIPFAASGIESSWDYVGSFQLANGAFVGHVYSDKEVPRA